MSKLKSNFIYDAIYQILILIIPFITTPYIARTIGVDGVGIYSYTYSIVNYFMMFALLGMNNYGNREVAKNKDNSKKLNEVFTEIYLLQFIVTLIVSSLYAIYICFFDQKYFLISIIQGIYLLSVFFDINWLFCGLQEFKVTVTRSGFIKILTLILIFIFIKGENDLWKYVLILALMTLLNQLILWPFLKGRVKFVNVKFKNIFKHLKSTLILFIPVVASSIYKVMDKIMVGNFSTITEVGYYENSEKMLNIILSVVSALGTVTLPQMTYLFNNKKNDEYNKILSKSCVFLAFIVLPVIAGFLVISDDLVLLYLGESFKKSAVLLKILSISLLFTPLASIIRMQVLIPQGRDKEYIVSVIIGAIVNFTLNILLIKRYQAIGASIATVISEAVVLFIEIYYSKKDLTLKNEMKYLFRFLVSSIIMFVCVYIVGLNIKKALLRLVIQILIGIFIYFVMNIEYIKSIIDLKKILNRRKEY